MLINKVLEAIKKINPDAQASITDEDLNTIRWENGTEPIARSLIEAQIPTVEQEITAAAAQKIADKESANAKLRALGLTDDEIEAFKS